MRGVQASTVPHHTDANVGEVWVDDVAKVARRRNERIHYRIQRWAGADVLAKLAPILGDTFTDWIRMANEVAFSANTIALSNGPTA